MHQQPIITSFFKDLRFFEKEHIYTVEDKKLPSVSGLIKNYAPKFDEQNVAIGFAKKVNKSVQEILDLWEDKRVKACDNGHKVHLFGEAYMFDRSLKPSCKQEEAIVKFWNDIPSHIVPAFSELQMYHKIYGFAGTSDIILYDTRTKNYIIADYKTNEELYKNHKGQTLLAPFTNLLDSPLNKYQLQLSFYQILFEQTGFQISKRLIVWLLRDGNYDMISTEDLTKPLLQELNKKII